MERHTMPVDVLFVGGGPASLAGAIHLMDLIQQHNATAPADEQLDAPMIALIDRGTALGASESGASQGGAQAVSGEVLDPVALQELVPDWQERGDFPLERTINRQDMYLLTEKRALKAPMVAPFLQDHGLPIISVARFQRWLAGIAAGKGVKILSGLAGVDLLWDADDPGKVVGVRTGDKGVDKDGSPKPTYVPGMDLEAKITVLGEGPRGHLSRILINKLELDRDSQPQVYQLGCTEVLEMPPGSVKRGEVTLLAGFPLDLETFGDAAITTMAGDRICVEMRVSLDARDPAMDCQYLLQKLKNHPKVRRQLAGGKVVQFGARTVSVGGWASMPTPHAAGAMIVGDSASFFNPMRLKGIHLAMKSGMLAAETAFQALLSGDTSDKAMARFKDMIDASWIKTELAPALNWRAAMSEGLVAGGFKGVRQFLFGPGQEVAALQPDFEGMRKAAAVHGSHPYPSQDDLSYDGSYLVDKQTAAALSGRRHDAQQPTHLVIQDTGICATRCKEEYGNPCVRLCPAQVYSMVESHATGREELQVDFGNCVDCKACDIRDPYQIIQWVPPEGGQGAGHGLL